MRIARRRTARSAAPGGWLEAALPAVAALRDLLAPRLDRLRGKVARQQPDFSPGMLQQPDLADQLAQTLVLGQAMRETWRRRHGLAVDSLAALPGSGAMLGRLLGACIDAAPEVESNLAKIFRRSRCEDADSGEVQSDTTLAVQYEVFLKQHDRATRRRRGVYFTPPEVAAHLLRSLERVMRRRWRMSLWLPGGFDGSLVDPAAGSGVFLQQAILAARGAWTDARSWPQYVATHLLPKLVGLEILLPAYAVCRWSIPLLLWETGYHWQGDEPLPIYWANALDVVEPAWSASLPMPAHRWPQGPEAAAALGDSSVSWAVIGNPPWSAQSANLAPHQRAWIAGYRPDLRKVRNPLQAERNLNDDYVKFLALAEALARRGRRGAVALLTSHSYIDGEYHGRLRASLRETFRHLWCLDLRGHRDKRQAAPGGLQDENLFPIAAGAALLVGLHDRQEASSHCAKSGDLWGTQQQKRQRLCSATIDRLATRHIDHNNPAAEFRPADAARRRWLRWPRLDEVLHRYSAATETGFDRLLLDFDRSALVEKIQRFANDPGDPLRQAAGPVRGLAGELARQPERLDADNAPRYVRPIQFRPFDWRWAYLKRDCLKTPAFARFETVSPERPGLATTGKSQGPFAVLAVGGVCAHKLLQAYDRTLVFSPPASVEELHALVALLTVSDYARRFGPWLRSSLPRVPRIASAARRRQLELLGADLTALHLMMPQYPHASWNASGPATQWPWPVPGVAADAGPRHVEARCVRYDPAEQALWFNRQAAIRPVPPQAADFTLGSYRVLASFLKQRHGRRLSDEDLHRLAEITGILLHLHALYGQLEAVAGHRTRPPAPGRNGCRPPSSSKRAYR